MPPSLSNAPGGPKSRIGFAISTKDRTHFTEKVLPGLDCGGFDLVWCDGSKTPEGRAFANSEHFKQTPLIEIHHDVTGGPDKAIQFSLKRLLELGYDYVGLIENDIQLKPGWLQAMFSAWQAAEKDGFKVGAVTARSINSRVLAAASDYLVKWNIGAGMVLFSRAAAEAVLQDYAITTAKEIHGFYQNSLGVDLSDSWELFMDKPDRDLGADWRYVSSILKHGLVGVGTIPSFAENIDLDIGVNSRSNYISSPHEKFPVHCLTAEDLKPLLVRAGKQWFAAPLLDTANRILFARTDSIGDAVLASAMLEPLRRRYPTAQIAVLCQQHVAELFVTCPFVSSIICYDRKKVETNAAERAQIISEIAAFQPDVILNSVRSRDKLSDELTLAFAGAKHVAIECDLDNISEADRAAARARYDLLIPSNDAHKIESARHADFLHGLGLAVPPLQATLWTSADDEAVAAEFFKQEKLDPQKTIALFPFTQHAIKDYPHCVKALADFGGWNILLFGGPETVGRCANLAPRLRGTVFNLAGKTTLREMAALIRRCRLFVGSDSAGAHIACAVGTPNVVVVGGGHFGRFLPYSPLTSVVTLPLECFGCNWRCPHQLSHCVKDLAPEVLSEAIRQTLKKNSPRARIFLHTAETWASGLALPKWQSPDARLDGLDAEIIPLRAGEPKSKATLGVSLPPNHERIACPACGSRGVMRVRQSADIVQCYDCETVYLRTRLTPDAMRRLYQSYADEGSHMALPKSRADAEHSGLKRDYFLKEILPFVPPGGGWLDIGCGWGGFLLNVRQHGFTPRGIELTRACVNYANAELQIPVVDSQLEETEIVPGSLRVVTMNHVFEHLPEPRQALKKVLASLEPGGMFCGIVPNFASTCSEILGDNWYWLDPNYHYQHFTPVTLGNLLESAGFVVEKIYTATGDYGPDAVRQACLKRDPKLANDEDFKAELARLESAGRGEEIRFFARKPVVPAAQAPQLASQEECLLIPEISTGPEPVISVVVSTYQSEKLISACLDNLSHQKNFSRIEVIVVDSGSPENERAIVADFQKRFPNIRYVRTPRETLYAAWNRALHLARGRYFANVNTDDSLRNDALEILAAALDRHADCALAYADCAWTTKPNDTFPSAHTIRTVRYPHYAPIETLFYCTTGCLQFWRTEAIRQLGGFDASLRCAGDYEATLKLMATRRNAVHVPEILSLFYQNTSGLTQASNRAALEHDAVMNRYRAALDITCIFQVPAGDAAAKADALAALGTRAMKFSVPWEDQPCSHTDFAFDCFHAALTLDPENRAAGSNLVALNHQLNRLNSNEAELVRRWPKMREWIARFRAGEGAYLLNTNHALTGPVYRPAEWSHRPTAAQLANEPAALRPWIYRIDGRHVYLSEDIFPRPTGVHFQPEELQAAAQRLVALLTQLPPFYAHLGGAGDALLLLASFYDQKPDAVVFSHPNGVGAARALFDAFPKLSKIYFLPQQTEPFFHIILRHFVHELRNCLGAGATPKDDYDVEWKANLDIEKKYRIRKTPRWSAAWRHGENSRRITLAPKGSLTGMVGSKRNLILPELWPQVIAHIQERGFEPVILGVPGEAKDYPSLPGCVDARGESFPGQMKLIGQSAGVVGADSWAKTFSALAEIPTLVFEPIKGADIGPWKDPSDWVFIEPWPSIKMIRTLEEFRRAFDTRIAKISGAEPPRNPRPAIAWQGSFLDYGSLSHINRELTARLSAKLNLTRVGPNVLNARAKADSATRRCARQVAGQAPAATAVTVRQQWPPDWSRPASGSLVVIQPWEYGALPAAWVEQAANVDEFWVPSPLVRAMYLYSGIAPERVRVVPNGVDAQKFRPGVTPLMLKTQKKFKFLFVGGTIFRKGPDILLDAFSKTFTSADDVCLVIKDFGGDSCYQGQTAEAVVRALQHVPGAPEILYLKDELVSDQMPSLYAACDCLVLPYRGEGFGLPVLEAMACGLPVIVTAGGATECFVSAEAGWKIPSQILRLPDSVGGLKLVKNGWLLDPNKLHLGALMKQAASHPAECRKRGAVGRVIVEKRFDWNDIAAAAAHRLKELAERAPVNGAVVAKPVTAPAKPVMLPPAAKIGWLAEARERVRQRKLPAAWDATLSALAKRPFHPEAFLLLAEIAQTVGDGSSAKQCAQHARGMAPGWKPAKKFLNQRLKGGTKPEWLKLPEEVQGSQSKVPSLSVCLIAKNEEKFLGQCLKSVRDAAAQIVVVDTGSTDRTVEIAKEHGAEVHSFAWCDDFSAARNAALEHATGDWVLMLDADEELSAEGREKLKAAMSDPAVMAWRLPMVDVGREADGVSYVPRLYRNAPGLFYVGRVHEQVFSSLEVRRGEWGLENCLGEVRLIHHGYTAEVMRDRKKIERNLQLLERAIAELPDEPHLLMNLGLELARSGRDAEALNRYREAFNSLSSKSAAEIVPELRETLLTQFCARLAAAKQFVEIVGALTSPLAKMNGGLTASLHFSLGLAHLELKQFREAADQMRQCLAKRDQRNLTPANREIRTAAPIHCLALALAKSGDAAGAEKAFLDGLKRNGRADELRLDYARFLAGQNRPVDALHQLHEMVQGNAQHADAWRLGGEIALSKPEFLEFARDWTGEAIRQLPDDGMIVAQRAEVLLLSQQAAEALPLWACAVNGARPPRALAAQILCATMAARPAEQLRNGAEEAAVSRAFVDWYRRLVTAGARDTIVSLNLRVETLRPILPSAAGILDGVIAATQGK